RTGPRGPPPLVTWVLLVATGVTSWVGVAALVYGVSGGVHDHAAILVAGRMASSASVLAVVTIVWIADGMHHAARTDTEALPVR
ncbi:hypothetical protein, partial [Curtobacterium sp. B18]|uniref:hypothetical protein n=1 Tax=Curtobacterium sp. B18 TaxID=95614 RepID=UPI001C9DF655